MHLGIFLPNWIGDVVMATPALRAIRKHVGERGRITGIMRPYVSDVLAGTNWLDDGILYTKKRGQAGARRGNAVKELRAAQFDSVLLLTNSFRTAWMARRSGASERIGYGGSLRGWLLTRVISQGRTHECGLRLPPIDAYLQLAGALGCPPESPRLELGTTFEDEQAADDVWKSLELPPGERVVVLNSGGAYGAAKHWPAEHFAELARRIVAHAPVSVLVNCGPAERDIAAEIVRRADDCRVVSLAGRRELPTGLTKACIRRSRMLVSTDSGPRFFGLAFGKPVVTLFGPTDPAATITHDDRETTLSLSLECQPCGKRTCPLVHHRCMRELSVGMVFAAVARHLNLEGTHVASDVAKFSIRKSEAVVRRH
jgi:heptosyltransferase-2